MSCVHLYDELISETITTFGKEVVEPSYEIFENLVDKFGLHARWELLVEIEFFDNDIEIVEKGLFNVFLNLYREFWGNVVGLPASLHFQEPSLQIAHVLTDDIVEGSISQVGHVRYSDQSECCEADTDHLQEDDVDPLSRCTV